MNRNITATILLVLAVGVYLTFTRGKWDEVKSIQSVNGQYSEAIKNADKLIQVRDEVLAKYNAISAADQDRLNKMLPNTVDNIRLIIDLNNAANRKGLSLSGVQVAAAAETGNVPANMNAPTEPYYPSASAPTGSGTIPTPVLDTVGISFSINAPFREFVAFMRDIESNLRLMDVTHLTLSTGENGNYNFSVGLRTYWLKQQ